MEKKEFFWGTGRRKTSVARVRISRGNGDIMVNGKEFKTFFPMEREQKNIMAPLKATSLEGKVDIRVNVKGGGITGQAGALVLGIARGLKNMDSGLEESLREHGLLAK